MANPGSGSSGPGQKAPIEVEFQIDANKKKQIEECLKKGAAKMKLIDSGTQLSPQGGAVTSYEWD